VIVVVGGRGEGRRGGGVSVEKQQQTQTHIHTPTHTHTHTPTHPPTHAGVTYLSSTPAYQRMMNISTAMLSSQLGRWIYMAGHVKD